MLRTDYGMGLMNAKELAEKIIALNNDGTDWDQVHIESLLSEAFRKVGDEIIDSLALDASPISNKIKADSAKAAYLDAAKIVGGWNLPDGNEFYWYKQKSACAKVLRQKAGEGK